MLMMVIRCQQQANMVRSSSVPRRHDTLATGYMYLALSCQILARLANFYERSDKRTFTEANGTE